MYIFPISIFVTISFQSLTFCSQCFFLSLFNKVKAMRSKFFNIKGTSFCLSSMTAETNASLSRGDESQFVKTSDQWVQFILVNKYH